MTYVCALPLLLAFAVSLVYFSLLYMGLPVESLIKIFHWKRRLRCANLVVGIEDISGYYLDTELINYSVIVVFYKVIKYLQKSGIKVVFINQYAAMHLRELNFWRSRIVRVRRHSADLVVLC